MAVTDLTTTRVLCGELGLSQTDIRLVRLIKVASAAVVEYLNRRQIHYSAEITEKVRGPFQSTRLILDVTPLGAIDSISFGGSEYDAASYEIEDARLGFVRIISGAWPWTAMNRGGITQEALAGSEQPVITAVYAGGWVTPAQALSAGWSGPTRNLPDPIEEATVQTAVALYRQGGRDSAIGSESLGNYSVSYRSTTDRAAAIPEAAALMLEPYRRLL